MIDEIFRQLGIALICFIIGMNSYILHRVGKSKKLVIHKKVKSFKKMTTSIQWLYINQTILFGMVLLSRYQRLIANAPLTWLDWAGIPLFISYILFNVYLVQNYIQAALKGSLFDKKEIPKMHLD
jgi:hypothetical protein